MTPEDAAKVVAKHVLWAVPTDTLSGDLASGCRAAADETLAAVRSERVNDTVWHAFHRAWTACVGTKRYDKAPWRECAKQVGYVVGPNGHASVTPPPDQPATVATLDPPPT